MMMLVKDLKATHGVHVKYIHCNADKNKAFKILCKQEEMHVKLEYIMSSTPQKNDYIEQKLEMLFNCI